MPFCIPEEAINGKVSKSAHFFYVQQREEASLLEEQAKFFFVLK